MKDVLGKRPSASMMVAILALVVATAGTAVAASGLVNGDNLIAKHSLSANRLHNHTITGTQVNLGKLGKVPSAKNADHATSATNASGATNALHAGTASSAGSAAVAGGPVAWARVSAAGVVLAGRGITSSNVKAESNGTYCIYGLPAYGLIGVSIDSSAASSLNDVAQASAGDDAGGDCLHALSTPEYNVQTENPNTGSGHVSTGVNDGFYVWFGN